MMFLRSFRTTINFVRLRLSCWEGFGQFIQLWSSIAFDANSHKVIYFRYKIMSQWLSTILKYFRENFHINAWLCSLSSMSLFKIMFINNIILLLCKIKSSFDSIIRGLKRQTSETLFLWEAKFHAASVQENIQKLVGPVPWL